jgi:hypothetical protein
MKKLFIISLSALLSCLGTAQKIDLDRVFVPHQYRDLPSTPLDSTWRTYNVRVEVPSTISNAMSASSIEERVNLQGWKKVYGGGHAQFTVNFDDLMFDGQKIDQRKEETKNKEGVVTATRYYYWSTVKYSLGATYSAKDWQSNVLINRSTISNSTNKMEWKSPEFSSYSEAERYFSNNRQAISNKLVKEHMESWLNSLNYSINDLYGFPVSTDQASLWTSDSKKHPENEAWVANMAKMKASVAKITANGIDAATRAELMSSIEYMTGVRAKYAADEKSDRKLRYACDYNNAVLYTILDMPDKAIESCNALVANDYDTKDGEKMIEKLNKIKELMAKNNKVGRHYSIDTSKFNTPN